MPATFLLTQSNGTISAITNTTVTEVNFMSSDSSTSDDYTDFPITKGYNSTEVWLRARFVQNVPIVGISNIRFWKRDGDLRIGETLKFGLSQVYDSPVSTISTYATNDVPTSIPDSSNVSIDGALPGMMTNTQDGLSDWIVLQLQTSSIARVGETRTFTFGIEYDEA